MINLYLHIFFFFFFARGQSVPHVSFNVSWHPDTSDIRAISPGVVKHMAHGLILSVFTHTHTHTHPTRPDLRPRPIRFIFNMMMKQGPSCIKTKDNQYSPNCTSGKEKTLELAWWPTCILTHTHTHTYSSIDIPSLVFLLLATSLLLDKDVWKNIDVVVWYLDCDTVTWRRTRKRGYCEVVSIRFGPFFITSPPGGDVRS